MGDFMKTKNRIGIYTLSLFLVMFMAFTVFYPKASYDGVKSGILLCSAIIIPSLFPFSVCCNFLMSVITPKKSHYFTEKELVFLLSLLGGYPVGAGLVDKLYMEEKISKLQANCMLCYCVNSGPAFILLAVGKGILNSKILGIILLASHILASFVLCVVFNKKVYITKPLIGNSRKRTVSEIFVNATEKASTAMISICSGVIFFSAINSCLKLIFGDSKLNLLLLLTEISYAVTQTKNLYLLSFALGFGGLCVWFQILGSVKSFAINIPQFIVCRLLHGGISALLTFVLIKIIKPTISTFSNNISFTTVFNTNGYAASISLLCMILIFAISLYSENLGRKMTKDIV